jgi:tRNA(Arg) A34 adenosine deaminase TadA
MNAMRHDRWLDLAIELARKNPNTRHKHGAVLVQSGRVLAVGLNTERAAFYPSRHAEWHAVREHLDSKADLYVARIMRNGTVAYSEPCAECTKQLTYYTKVRNVYYTDQSIGLDYSILDLARFRREMKEGKLK